MSLDRFPIIAVGTSGKHSLRNPHCDRDSAIPLRGSRWSQWDRAEDLSSSKPKRDRGRRRGAVSYYHPSTEEVRP